MQLSMTVERDMVKNKRPGFTTTSKEALTGAGRSRRERLVPKIVMVMVISRAFKPRWVYQLCSQHGPDHSLQFQVHLLPERWALPVKPMTPCRTNAGNLVGLEAGR